jgi:hypothetical protein
MKPSAVCQVVLGKDEPLITTYYPYCNNLSTTITRSEMLEIISGKICQLWLVLRTFVLFGSAYTMSFDLR